MLDDAAQGLHLFRRTGDPDDSYRPALHADGQVHAAESSLSGRVLVDDQTVQPLFQKLPGTGVDLPHACRVCTGQDAPGLVHQVDVAPGHCLHFPYNGQCRLLCYQHTASSVVLWNNNLRVFLCVIQFTLIIPKLKKKATTRQRQERPASK